MNEVKIDLTALGCFVAATGADDIPDETWTFGRLLLLDSLGALIGGLRYPAVRRLGETLDVVGDPSGTVPFGWTTTLGAAATWLDADSGGSFHQAGARIPPVPTAHPAPHVLPGLLHALARGDVDDDAAIAAFVIGCEVGLRFGAGTSLRPGLHPHGIHGPIATAVALSALNGVDAETATRAIELGGSLPLAATLAVPMRGGTVRNLWTGVGSYYGALAAATAADRVVTDRLTDELYDGVVTTDVDIDELTGGLGARWRMHESYIKPYACARWVHPALDALHTALAEAGGPLPSEITAIEVETFAFAASLDSRGAESDLHARFSIPRCVASVVVDGRLDADGFLPGRFERPEVAMLVDRVHVRELPEFSAELPERRPARVTVRTIAGRWTAEVPNARGNPDSALTVEEVVEKFLGNVGPFLPCEVLDQIVDTLVGPTARGARGTALRELAVAVRSAVV